TRRRGRTAEKSCRRERIHCGTTEGYSRIARETRKTKRSSAPPRRRFRDVPCSPQFQVRQAPQLSGEGARRDRGKRELFPRGESGPQLSSEKSRSQLVRHRDRAGVAPVRRAAGASGWNTQTWQGGRGARIWRDPKKHRQT